MLTRARFLLSIFAATVASSAGAAVAQPGNGGDMSSVAQSFNRIMAWAGKELPMLVESMRPGASEAEIASLEAVIGQSLPDDVRALYALADGQTPFEFGKTPHYPGLFFGHPFNPIESVKRDWSQWQSIDRSINDDSEFESSFPPGAVKALVTNPGWIPLSDDAGGNHMGVDLDPGPHGNPGQWIVFGTDEQEKVRVASSLGALLSWIAGEIEQGHLVVQSGAAAGESGPWLWREGEHHFHDAIRKHLKAGGKVG